MSTFGGITREYPEVAIDYFSGKQVLKARAYFLSHVHSDHMHGLHSSAFANHLEKHPNYKLYCSEVTKEFLLTSSKHKHLKKSLVALPVQQQCDVKIPNDITGEAETLQVTLLPAGHCPGSVMFLLEGAAGNVLYTGDFRFKIGDAAEMEALHEGTGVKPLKSMYIDTTFFDPEVMFIPSREHSCEAMLRLIEEQVQQGPRHMVYIKCRAKYGYEYLFMEISRALGMKVHVSGELMKQYRRVPELAEHMTTNGSKTQIHACRRYACTLEDATDVITIAPSTMWFNSFAQSDDVLKRISSHYFRLCFSFHSSYSEICDFIRYLKPRHIYPNVIPYNSTEHQMIERLQSVLREEPGVTSNTGFDEYKPLGRLMVGKKRKRKKDQSKEDLHNKSLEALFDIGSPQMSNKMNILDHSKDDEEEFLTKHTKLTEYGSGEMPTTVEAGTGPCADDSSCTSDDGRWTEEEGGTSDSLFSEEEDEDDEDHRVERQEHFKEDPSDQSSKCLHSSLSQSPTFVKYLPSSKQEPSIPGQALHLHLKSIPAQRYFPGSRDCLLDETVKPDSGRDDGSSVSPTEGPAVERDETISSSKSRMKLSQRIATSCDTVLSTSCKQVSSEFAGLGKQKDGDEENGNSKKGNSLQNCKLESHELRMDPQNERSTPSIPKSVTKASHKEDTDVNVCRDSSANSCESSNSQDSVSPCKSFLQYLPSKSVAKEERDPSGFTSRINEGPLVGSRSNKNIPGMKKIDRNIKSNENIIQKEPDRKTDEENKDVLVNMSTKHDTGVTDSTTCELGCDITVRGMCQNGEQNDNRMLPKCSTGRPTIHTDDCNIVKRNTKLVSSEKCSGETAMQNVERGIIVVDLTKPLKADSVCEDEEEVAEWSQDSETTVVISPSIKSSQETYLSPSKCLKNNSQDIFILSSPESSDATPDCIELL